MRIKATFTGQDKSMGFFHGQSYELQVLQPQGRPVIIWCHPSAKGIRQEGFTRYQCPYGSWKAFWKNWEFAK